MSVLSAPVGGRVRAWLVGPAGPILGAYLGSRLLTLLAAVGAETLVPRNPLLTGGASGPILTSLTSWDGWWYLEIARHGYHVVPLSGAYRDYAFFPLWPFLVRFLSLLTPAFMGLIAVLLSNLLFLVALALFYQLTRKVLDEERAVTSAVYLCIFPFAWVFSMAYAESLFLVLSLGSLLAAERGRAGWAAILASLAAVTRLPGILLVVPLALILWRRCGDRRKLAWLVVVPLGVGLFWAYTVGLTGSVGGFLAAQSAWGRTGAGEASTGGASLGSSLDALRGSFLLTLLGYVFLLVYFRPDRIPLAYALIPILTLGAIFISGNISSIGRLGMVAFPFVWVLAGRRSTVTRSAWPLLSSGLLALLGLLIFAGYYQP